MPQKFPNCAQTQKKGKKVKKEKENCTSSPIFASDTQFLNLTPVFQTLRKSEKKGQNKKKGTRLGTELERSLRKT